MRKNWKAVLSVLLTGGIMISSAACSSGNEDLVSGNEGNSKGDKEKLVFLRAGTEDYKKDAFMQMIEGFEKEHPEYEVEYQEAPWGDDFETKLNTA